MTRAAFMSIPLLAGAGWLACALAAEVPPPPAIPPDAAAAPSPQKPKADVKGRCVDCAVIRSIRQIERERPAREMPSYIGSPQYLESRQYSQPQVGPVFGIRFGPGRTSETYVGAAGSETMRRRIVEISYEVIVRFDDGRFSRIELADIGDLRAGDRVRVVDNRTIERAPDSR
jgi:hypothetical protein